MKCSFTVSSDYFIFLLNSVAIYLYLNLAKIRHKVPSILNREIMGSMMKMLLEDTLFKICGIFSFLNVTFIVLLLNVSLDFEIDMLRFSF